MNFSRLLAIAIDASISIVWDISLGSSIKSLGDWVKSSAGAKGDSSSISIGIGVSGIVGISVSRPLANVVTSISSISSIRKGDSLGHSIKSLGDGVKTSAGAKGDSSCISIGIGVSSIVGISISRPLANVVTIVSSISSIWKNSSLGHSIKSLGDWVQTSAGAKGYSRSIGVAIAIGKIGSISVSSGSCHKASEEKCLDHVP